MLMCLVVYVLYLLLKLLRIDTYFLISTFCVYELLSRVTTKNMEVYLYTRANPILLYERSIYLFSDICKCKIELIPTQNQIVFIPFMLIRTKSLIQMCLCGLLPCAISVRRMPRPSLQR
jgi:hypothetical protein